MWHYERPNPRTACPMRGLLKALSGRLCDRARGPSACRAARHARRYTLRPKFDTRNLEHRTQNPEHRTRNPELRPRNPEPGTRNLKPRTQNPAYLAPDPNAQVVRRAALGKTCSAVHPAPETRNPEPRTRYTKSEIRNPSPSGREATTFAGGWPDSLRGTDFWIFQTQTPKRNARSRTRAERDFIDNLLARIHVIIEMMWWTGLAP